MPVQGVVTIMRPIRRILVAVKDGQAKSQPAVAKATQLARSLGARLELYHAIDTLLYVDQLGLERGALTKLEQRWSDRSREQLESLAAEARRAGIEVTTVVEWDFPAYEAVVRRAARTQADLIVAQCHPRRHVAPWLMHFTDWELVRLAAVPVLLVKNPQAYRRPVVLAALDPTHAFAKPTKLDAEILGAARTLSSALHGSLHAMHAYSPLPAGVSSGFDGGAGVFADIAADIEADAAAHAKAGFDRLLKTSDIPRSRQHLVGRHPIDAIQDVARETHAAIVAMGAISRSGLKRIFIGNTAERVLDHLESDVLIVKPPHFVNHIKRGRRGVRLTMGPAILQ